MGGSLILRGNLFDCVSMTARCVRVCLVAILALSGSWAPADARAADTRARDALLALQEGEAGSAAEELSALLDATSDPTARFLTLLQRGEAYRIAGRFHLAREDFRQAEALAAAAPGGMDARGTALLQWRWALADQYAGDAARGEARLREALRLGAAAFGPLERAALLNDLAVAERALGRPEAALERFEEAMRLAREAPDADPVLAFRASLNAARLRVELGRFLGFRAEAEQLEEELKALAVDGAERIRLQLALGDLLASARARFALPAELRASAYALASDAVRRAQAAGDRTLEALAVGQVALLYEEEQRDEEALALAQRAVVLAQEAPLPARSYHWHWLSGRTLDRLGDTGRAAEAYAAAVAALRQVRTDLQVGTGDVYREVVGPIFYEYADLLLRDADGLADAARRQEALASVRSLLEEVKVVEVRDYFRNDCLPLEPSQVQADAFTASRGVAVLYPVVLRDRVELLLSSDGVLESFRVEVSRGELEETADAFRREVQIDALTKEYLRLGNRLYGWLVGPLSSRLARHNVETLVVVPDASLRSIPFAALYDGEEFLIERFALATTPGVSLSDPRPVGSEGLSLLAGGLSERSADSALAARFDPLSHVRNELDFLGEQFGVTPLMNASFTLETLRTRLRGGDFRVAHFATHGVFAGSYDDSYLVTWDGALTLDALADTISARPLDAEPLELLVLSACQTAAGDDRAALGLAGVALRAGARSALGSLWAINDAAAADLVQNFYDAIAEGGVSRAEALRRAQLELMRTEGYDHPSIWAPFLMIGNWL